MAKKGYDIVKDELNGNPAKKKHLGFDPSSIPRVERSATSGIAIVPTKQSRWSKKWEAFRLKVRFYACMKYYEEVLFICLFSYLKYFYFFPLT